MPPWEENDAQFGDDVGVGNVEVVFECRDGNETTELNYVSKLVCSSIFKHGNGCEE
jgi:hypothetical protein